MLTLPNRNESQPPSGQAAASEPGGPNQVAVPVTGALPFGVQLNRLLLSAGFGLVQPGQEGVVGGQVLVVVDAASPVPADGRGRGPGIGADTRAGLAAYGLAALGLAAPGLAALGAVNGRRS